MPFPGYRDSLEACVRVILARCLALCLGVTAVLSAGRAGASTTRVHSLGGLPDMLEDVVNVYEYPALLTRYPNLGLADLGRVVAPETYGTLGNLRLTGRSIGGLVRYHGVPALGVNGLVLGREVREEFAPDPVPAPGDGVELLYGRSLGERSSVGLRGYFAGSSAQYEEIGRRGLSRREASIRKLTLGVGRDLGSDSRLDLAVSAGSRSFRADTSSALGTYTAALARAGRAPWTARGRLESRLAPDVTLRAYYGYARDDFSYTLAETRSGAAESSRSERPVWREDLGVSLTLEANENYTLFVGAAYDTEHRQSRTFHADTLVTDSPSTWTESPVLVAGGEIRLWPWLSVRTAARKPYTLNERDSTNADPYCGCVPLHVRSVSFPTFFSLGAQVRVDALDLDVQLNERTPFVMGFFASGAPVVPVIGVSATYHFDSGPRRSRGRRSSP